MTTRVPDHIVVQTELDQLEAQHALRTAVLDVERRIEEAARARRAA